MTIFDYDVNIEGSGATRQIVQKILSIAVATTKINTVFIDRKNNQFMNRIPMHVCIHGIIGNGKSTALRNIGKIQNMPINTSLTKAAILGSIDSMTKMFVPPLIWMCRNNVCLLDEFEIPDAHSSNRETFLDFINVLEAQRYSRTFGINAKQPFSKKESKGNLWCKMKKNVIDVKTNFSFICTTMKSPYESHNRYIDAFYSRCVPLHFNPTLQEMNEMVYGKLIFNIDIINPPYDVVVKFPDLKFIVEYVTSKDMDKKFHMRTIEDCIRCFAVLGFHDEELYNYLCVERNYFSSRHRWKKQ
jgi:hypothetical protein